MGTTRGLAIGMVAGLLAACGGTAETADEPTSTAEVRSESVVPSEPEPTQSEEPTAVETVSDTASDVIDITAVAAGERPDDGWVLEGGTYSSSDFDGLAFDIPAGTLLRHVATDGSIAVTHDDFASSDDLVWIIPADGIVPPEEVGTHISHDQDPLEFSIAVPTDLGSWFEAVPQLEVLADGAGDSPLGSYRWWDVELRPENGDTFSDCGHQACVHNVVTEIGAAIHADIWTMRYAQHAAAPHVLVWSQEREGTGPAADFVEGLVASVTSAS